MKRDLGHGYSIYRMVIYTKLQFGRFLFKETPGAFYHWASHISCDALVPLELEEVVAMDDQPPNSA